MSEKLIKSTLTSFVPEKMKVVNTSKTDLRINNKFWAMGNTIEVSRDEALSLHAEGHKVLDEESEKHDLKLKAALEDVKEEGK